MANNLSANDFQLGVQVVPKTETLDAEFKKISQTKSINVDVKIDGQSFKNVNKVVETYSNNLGTTQQKIRILNQENEELYSKLNKITNKFKPFNQEVKKSSQNLSETAKTAKQASGSITNLGEATSKAETQAKSLGQSFGDIVTKVGKFYLATKPIQMMQQAFDEAVETVKDFDDAMTDLRKVSDLDGEALTDYTIKLGELGEAVYRSRTEMTEAAVLFKQTGASDEDAAKLAQLANLYMNVADNEMTAADASAYITSQMKAFKITANDAITILDKTNEVSNKFAVSSSDISRALTTSSSSLAVYGNDINETMALVTAGAEIMTGKSQQVGRGLRSIGANISALASSAGELKFQVNGATETISLIDEETGDMVNTFQTLSEIHKYWDKMTASEKAALATTLAGKTQLDVFSSVLSNFNTAIEANTVAVESNGSAWEENNKRADSISAKLNLLKSQFQELVLGKGGLQDFSKNLLDVGIAMLKFANSDIGQVIIKTVLLTTGIVAANHALKALMASKFVAWASEGVVAIQILGEAMIGLATKTGTASNAVEAFNLALETLNINPIVLLITACVGGAIALTSALDKANKALGESADKLKELKSNADSAKQEVETLTSSLQDIQNKLDNISNEKLKITDTEQLSILEEQSNELKDQEETLKRQLALAIQKAQITKDEAQAQAQQTLETKTKSEFTSSEKQMQTNVIGAALGTFVPGGGIAQASMLSLGERVTAQEELQRAIDSYTELYNQKEELQRQMDREEKMVGVSSERYQELSDRMDELNAEQDKVVARGNEMAETLNNANSSLEESNPLISSQVDSWTAMTGATEEAEKQIQSTSNSEEDFDDTTNEVSTNIEKLASSLKLTNSQLERYSYLMQDADLEEFLQQLSDIREASDDASTGIDNLQSALETAVEAQAEYESNGKLTLDTFQSLMGVNADYLTALENENGQIEINQTTLGNLVETMKAAKIEELQQAAAADILAYSQGNMAEVSDFAKGLVADLGSNIETTGEQAKSSALKMNTFSLSVGEAITAMGGTVKWSDNGQRAILQGYKDIAKQVAELTIDTTTYGNASSKAHNKSARSTKSEKSALDQLKDKYKDVINFILDGYDKQIDKLEDARDTEIDVIEDQIDAIEKERDSQLDAIDAEIDALEKERDARKEYWDAQLDALEKNNNAVNDAITLQEKLNALATAQQTKQMVFKNGRFQYSSDEEAVSSAQSDIDEFNREQEYKRQKELLEQLRDDELNNYDERLEALQDFRTEREKYYEDLKEQLEDQKDYLKDYYENRINDLKAQKEATKELLENGVKDQKEYEDKMLAQLGNFVADWNATVGAMSFPDISGSGIDIGKISVSQTSSGGSSTKTTKTTTVTKPKTTTPSKSTKSKDKNIHVKGGRIMAYASGTNSIKDNEIALVGDNPKYRELVIGSKLNNDQGTLMRLSSGSGVVNADSTKTLASIFNSLSGQINSAPFANNGVNNGTTISIGSISLPEVKDGQGFVDYMQHFSTDITQQSFNRV